MTLSKKCPPNHLQRRPRFSSGSGALSAGPMVTAEAWAVGSAVLSGQRRRHRDTGERAVRQPDFLYGHGSRNFIECSRPEISFTPPPKHLRM